MAIADTLRTARYSRELVTPGHADAGAMVVRGGATTYPCRDLDGDFVVPDGGDWADYPADPLVNYEHAVRVGRGSVTLRAGSEVFPGDPVAKGYRIPVLTTTFFQSARDLSGLSLGGLKPAETLEAAEQTFRMVERGYLRGLSLEFYPRDGYAKSLGRSPRGHRDAYEFRRWKGVGVAHCLRGVNPRAGMRPHLKSLAVSLPPEFDGLRVLAESGRFPGLDGRSLSPLIRKSLDWIRTLPRPAAVVGGYRPETKSMDPTAEPVPDDLETGPATDPVDDVADDAGMGDDTPPTSKATYDAIQQANDVLAGLEAQLGRSEHRPARKKLRAVIENIRAELQDAQAVADKLVAEMAEEDKPAPESAPEGDAETGDDEAAPADESDDEDPFEKSLRRHVRPLEFEGGVLVTKSRYVPRRAGEPATTETPEATGGAEPSPTFKALFERGMRAADAAEHTAGRAAATARRVRRTLN